jgi:hypothetical protein
VTGPVPELEGFGAVDNQRAAQYLLYLGSQFFAQLLLQMDLRLVERQ